MGERNTGIGRDAQRRGDPRDDLERDARVGEGLGLFPAPPEDERVAPFEPDDGQAAPGAVDQHAADLFLRIGMRGLLLAHVEALGPGRREIQEALGRQVVEQHAIRAFEGAASFQGEQIGVAWSCADEVDLAHAHE